MPLCRWQKTRPNRAPKKSNARALVRAVHVQPWAGKSCEKIKLHKPSGPWRRLVEQPGPKSGAPVRALRGNNSKFLKQVAPGPRSKGNIEEQRRAKPHGKQQPAYFTVAHAHS